MLERFEVLTAAVGEALFRVVDRAASPPPRVARHWESTTRLVWFGAGADHGQVHVSWSFGRLIDPPPSGRHSVGVFSLVGSAFPGVDGSRLQTLAAALVPPKTDGATRVFLQRSALQLAVSLSLLRVQSTVGCEVFQFVRPDALETAAPTPRCPAHARERIGAALVLMDPALVHRCQQVWDALPPTILEAVRSTMQVDESVSP